MRIRIISLIFAALWAMTAKAQFAIPPTITVKLNRLARIEASGSAKVKWINVHEDVDLIPDSTGRFATILCAKVGKYRIAAYTASGMEPSEPSYCTIICDAPGEGTPNKPKPDGKPKSKADPVKATVQLRIGNAGCTATIIGPRRGDGKWDCLTAAHCSASTAKTGQVTLKDSRRYSISVKQRNAGADLLWLTIDTQDDDLPFAELADDDSQVGETVWHNGYGFDRPGNVEKGTIAAKPNGQGQWRFRLSVSNGDSGGGIFRERDGKLIAAVCCTSRIAGTGDVWGGASTVANQMRLQTLWIHPVARFDRERGTEASDDEPVFLPINRFRATIE